ncbi:MAG TPA: hypothetical protein VHP33_39315 [Polyangiaceae bacterium]|nr:hypothetical protein [Polyangiaceae bacterium]
MAQHAYRLCFVCLSFAAGLVGGGACSSGGATAPQPAVSAGAGGDDTTPGSAGTHQAPEGGAQAAGGAGGAAGAQTEGGEPAAAGAPAGGGAAGGAGGSGGEGGGASGSGGEGGADGGSAPCSPDDAPAIHSVDAYVTPTSQLLIRGKNLAEVSLVTAIDSDQQTYKCFFKSQDVTPTSIRCDFGNAIPLSVDANDYYTIDVFTERCGHAPDPPWFEVVAELP